MNTESTTQGSDIMEGSGAMDGSDTMDGATESSIESVNLEALRLRISILGFITTEIPRMDDPSVDAQILLAAIFEKLGGQPGTVETFIKAGDDDEEDEAHLEIYRRYRTMEAAANRLQKESKGYLDSLRGTLGDIDLQEQR
jgi:hypothetical protein